MSLRIGRVSGLNEPRDWNASGDHVTVVGSYKSASLTDGLQRRDQLLGYSSNPDEAFIGVILDGEPRVSGYYYPSNVRILTDEHTRKQGNLYDYSIDLERVPGFAMPVFESVISGNLLTNVVGAVLADTTAFHAAPDALTEYSQAGTASTRTGSDGAIRYFNLGALSSTIAISYYLKPADFYTGAAMIEQGSPLQTVIGRQAQSDVTNWRLSNGLVRVTPSSTAGAIDVSHYNGSTWSAVKTYIFRGTGTYLDLTGLVTLAVMRNSVEQVDIRLGATVASSFGQRIFLDLSLRRGDRLVRGYLTSDIADTWQIRRSVTEAATAITYAAVVAGGIRATANDGDTNRYIILSYQKNVTNDLVNGKLTENATFKTFDFAIGSEIGGSGATSPNDAVSIAKQYIAAQAEKLQVVTR